MILDELGISQATSAAMMGASVGAVKAIDNLAETARDSLQQVNWVKNVLAELRGFDGPLGEACCPLREWLAEGQRVVSVPHDFVEYCIDFEDGPRHIEFDPVAAGSRVREAFERGETYTFSTEKVQFQEAWASAVHSMKYGGDMNAAARYALKLGVRAGMQIEM